MKHHCCEHFHEDECFPLHGITFDKIITNRDELVTFSLVESQTANTEISWEIHDKWLGSPKKSLYVPELKSTGSFEYRPAELTDYIPRLVTGTGQSITTNLFFCGPIEVKCFLKNGNESQCLSLLYYPKISKHNKIEPAFLSIKHKNVKCAPIFTTQKFAAVYDGENSDCLVCSQLTLEEEGNKTAKVVFAKEDDPVICEQTWQTKGKKYLTYTVWYDNGFYTVSTTFTDSYEIDRDEIRDKDDVIISCPDRPGHPPFPGNPPKVYVICTKRCWSDCANVNGVYEASTNSGNSGYDYT